MKFREISERKCLMMWNVQQKLQRLTLLIGVMGTAISAGVAFGGLPESSAAISSAQDVAPGRITGTVRRSGNEAVPAAIVIISDRDGHIRRTARTNSQGRFTFSELPAGSYMMQGCSDQFGPSASATVDLKAGMEVAQNLPITDDLQKTAERCIDLIGEPSTPRGPHEYKGELMSFDGKGDVRDFFRSIAQIGGVEVSVDASIKSTLAVHLKNIPWDLALDVVLRTAGLGMERDGKVVRVAPANPSLGEDRTLMGTMTITGTVVGVNFQNPRTQLQINAPDADGQMHIWTVDWESAVYLDDIGIKPNTLRAGDRVIITGNITRTNTIALISVQRPSQQDNQAAFSWGYLGPVRAALSNGEMFVGLASQ
jgi:hypothetical protein